MDYLTVSAAMSALKGGLDTVKIALDIFKEAKDSWPSGEQKTRMDRALTQATEKVAEGEAAVASALGFTLCRCTFPPVPMLKVGYIPIRSLNGMDKAQVLARKTSEGGDLTGAVAVHECPRCKTTDAPTYNFERSVPPP